MEFWREGVHALLFFHGCMDVGGPQGQKMGQVLFLNRIKTAQPVLFAGNRGGQSGDFIVFPGRILLVFQAIGGVEKKAAQAIRGELSAGNFYDSSQSQVSGRDAL